MEIPFRLEQQGRSGDLRLRADPDADGARPCRQDVVRLHSMRAPTLLSRPLHRRLRRRSTRGGGWPSALLAWKVLSLSKIFNVVVSWARGAEKYGPESLITARSGSDSFMSKSVPPRALGVRYAEASSRLALPRGQRRCERF